MRALLSSAATNSNSITMMVPRRLGSLWITSAAAVFCRHPIIVEGYYLFAPSHVVRRFQSAPTTTSSRSVATRVFGRDGPPDFTIEDDEESSAPSRQQDSLSDFNAMDTEKDNTKSTRKTTNGDGWDRHDEKPKSPRRKPAIRQVGVSGGASWMERNAKFSGAASTDEPSRNSRDDSQRGGERGTQRVGDNKTFRQDFRGTRVFVQGLPPDCSWQTLKDHFRVAGQVVFASVSEDPVTGRSKGHGIVQFETVDEAANAIAIMRNHPLDAYALYVREDVQENSNNKKLQQQEHKGPTPPTKWKCANEENASHLDVDTVKAIQQLLKARDQARRRRNYEASDNMREELRNEYGVQIDDRLTMWWTGAPPAAVKEIKGEGRWGDRATEWRQIPTTPDNDACVDPDLVQGLLKQRDIARREKDFTTADSLLEQARTAPDGDLYLRIHDESKTWRIWTDAPPPRPVQHSKGDDADDEADDASRSPAAQCIAICKEHAPEKMDEVRTLLEKFPGREFNILKKLKQRYLP
jgi:RNA recognition motif. (a.k.a. RRM, RBD, or RNP domain)